MENLNTESIENTSSTDAHPSKRYIFYYEILQLNSSNKKPKKLSSLKYSII